MFPNSLARQIDHTLLSPSATPSDVETLCAEALRFRFASVCVNSSFVALAARLLKGSDSLPVAVVGFPLGAMLTRTKVHEAREAVHQGARELDVVIALGALKAHDYRAVLDDLAAVVRAVDVPVKAILEMGALTSEEKIAACVLAQAAGAAFVKTSTGFGHGGATVEDIALMRRVVVPSVGVKASGGIRTRSVAEQLLAAGATRLGTSASVAIVTTAPLPGARAFSTPGRS